jgi:ribulose-5-phosphate 4-epimerase/fuculose-1-phosphate aldolase
MSPRGTQRGDERTLRQELLLAMQSMSERGLNRGTSGNASVRFGNRLLVTPSGVLPQALTAESMVLIDANGDAELAEAVVETLAGGRACLMANHGQIAAAGSLMHALAIAEEVEEQAAVYWGALAVGGPQLLTDAQMDEVLRRFAQYGQRRDAKDDQPSVGE